MKWSSDGPQGFLTYFVIPTASYDIKFIVMYTNWQITETNFHYDEWILIHWSKNLQCWEMFQFQKADINIQWLQKDFQAHNSSRWLWIINKTTVKQ